MFGTNRKLSAVTLDVHTENNAFKGEIGITGIKIAVLDKEWKRRIECLLALIAVSVFLRALGFGGLALLVVWAVACPIAYVESFLRSTGGRHTGIPLGKRIDTGFRKIIEWIESIVKDVSEPTMPDDAHKLTQTK